MKQRLCDMTMVGFPQPCVDQVCSVHQKLKEIISHGGRVGGNKVKSVSLSF